MKTETTATYIVMTEDHTYEYYGVHTIKRGARMRVGKRDGHGTLHDDGFAFTLGHGANELIPRDRFYVEDVVTETVTTTRRIRR